MILNKNQLVYSTTSVVELAKHVDLQQCRTKVKTTILKKKCFPTYMYTDLQDECMLQGNVSFDHEGYLIEQ